jgi:hypothetical protein
MTIDNEEQLYEKLKNSISYYEVKDGNDYPQSETVNVHIEMDDEQINEYKKHIKKILYKDIFKNIADDANIDVDMEVDFDEIDSKKKMHFLVQRDKYRIQMMEARIHPR